MSKLLAFLLGLLALILMYFCVKHHSPEIQNDLVNRTNQALTAEGSSFASVTANGRDLVLSGVAPDQAAKDQAGEIAKKVWGVREVDNQLTIASTEPAPLPEITTSVDTPAEEPETVIDENYTPYVVKPPEPLNTSPAMTYPTAPAPYKTSLSMLDGKLTLKGHVPDDASRYALVTRAKAQYGEDKVVDELVVAYGGPAGWHNAAYAALMSVGSLEGGKASLSDTTLSVSGHATNGRVAEQTKSEILDQLVADFEGDINITADEPEPVPEYVVEAPKPLDTAPAMTLEVPENYRTQYNFDSGKLTLTGSVPDQSARMWVTQLAGKAVGEANVIDELVVTYGAPQGWHAASSAALDHLTSLESGNAELQGQVLQVSGLAGSEAVKRDVEQGIERVVSAYQTAYDISYPEKEVAAPAVEPPPALSCQEKFDKELQGSKILFNTDEAVIKSESYDLLARLISVAKACPESAIEIGGHTDDRGPEAYNQWLSESRAKAVVDYLKAEGMTNPLNAVGYGEAQPIASNDSDEGMAKNRRIEFKVKGN